jgi:hypothetical protein
MTTGETLLSSWSNYITLEQEKAAAIDAAIAKAKRETRVECADALTTLKVSGTTGLWCYIKEAQAAILAMNDDPKPVSPSAKDVGPETTTLRDYFAAAALTGFYANPNGTYSYRWRHTDGSIMLLGPGQTPLTKGHGEWYVEAKPAQVMARDMYSAADAMLAERKKGA